MDGPVRRQYTRRSVLTVMVGTSAATLLAACNSTPRAPSAAPPDPSVPPGAQPTAPSPASTGPVAVTRVIQPLPTRDFGFLPSIVATTKGYFADEGLSVDMPVMTPPASAAAITAREIQFASAGAGIRAV